MKLRFTDGEDFDLAGPLRVICRRDGFYVIGRGMLCPVDSEGDGWTLVSELERGRAERLEPQEIRPAQNAQDGRTQRPEGHS